MNFEALKNTAALPRARAIGDGHRNGGPKRPEAWPGARTLRFAADPMACKLVQSEGALRLTTIAAVMGTSVQSVADGVAVALGKALKSARRLGVERELIESLRERAALAREPWPW